jgi:hypothetical protein
LLLDPVFFASAVPSVNKRKTSRITAWMFRRVCHFLRNQFTGPMHSTGISSIPPYDSANVYIACSPFRLNDRIDGQLSPLLVCQKEMKHTVDDYSILAAKISFCLANSSIFCASRLRVRYSDFGHNYGVIRSGLAGVF